jgi:hypothetical protein
MCREENAMRKIDKSALRFGVVAVGKEFITADQLFDAMKHQIEEDIEHKEHRPVGEILVSMGHLNSTQLKELLNEMAIHFGAS